MDSNFGTVLKEWRGQRRISQLDLGLSSNVSARHTSFLETGRARPSRSMVLQLCETLAQFGTAEDVALAELRIEMLFPADDFTKNALLGMANQAAD